MAGANQAGTMAVCVISTVIVLTQKNTIISELKHVLTLPKPQTKPAFTQAYMLADQVFMYIWCPHEKLFILHHWVLHSLAVY